MCDFIHVDGDFKGCYDHMSMKARNRSGLQHYREMLRSSLGWFIPGIGVKRWLLLILLGTTLVGVGLGVFLLDVYRTTPDTWWLPVLSAASLRFLARPLRIIIFGGIGLGLVFWGILELNRTIIKPFLKPGHQMMNTLRTHRQRERGPRIVAIGGGHGLANLLRGLKQHTYNLTAVVTVADDGGSSGRLRRDLGILPPGDIRNCLAALSNDEALLGQLFQYRFANESSNLDGHSFGNLFISALADITGSFEEAIAESGRVMGVHGRVLPSTLHDVQLLADMVLPLSGNEVRIEGESRIPASPGKVRHVWLEPNNPPAFPQVIQAILAADLIIIGPGSLYTSLIPNLLVPDLSDAIRSSRALKLYVCNLATQIGETDKFSCEDHVRALDIHSGGRIFDVMIANDNYAGKLPERIDWVRLDDNMADLSSIYKIDVIDVLHPWRHDSQKLAQAIIDLYQERTGPLVE